MSTAAWPGYPVGTDDITPPDWSGRRWQDKAQKLATQPARATFKDQRMAELQRRLARSAGQEPPPNVNILA